MGKLSRKKYTQMHCIALEITRKIVENGHQVELWKLSFPRNLLILEMKTPRIGLVAIEIL